MFAKSVACAAGALFVLGSAVPMNNDKRDIVYVTEVATAVVTVPVTTTFWVDPTDAPASSVSVSVQGNQRHYGHHNNHKGSSSSQAAAEAQTTASSQAASSAAAPSSYEAPSSVSSEAEQTTSTPEAAPATTEASVAPVSSYEAPSSSYEAPSSSYVAPVSVAPTSTYEAPSTSSAAAATSSAVASSYDTSSSSSGSSDSNPASGKSFTGEVTYFAPGMGACGHDSSESDDMVALSQTLFDQYTPNGNPNLNPLCGQKVSIKGADGQTHQATIWDRCVGCAEGDLDMPRLFFNTVTTATAGGDPADGRGYDYSWSMN